jgi:hypothetical protein
MWGFTRDTVSHHDRQVQEFGYGPRPASLIKVAFPVSVRTTTGVEAAPETSYTSDSLSLQIFVASYNCLMGVFLSRLLKS